jgi:4-hydroxybenzoate polyprenyltransferase
MINKSTLLHLRIPFSFFLLPVFLFAFGNSATVNSYNTILSFFIVHFLLYPASNGYNSYFDKDEKSIGLLKNPPPVGKQLYRVAIGFDLLALILGLSISICFSCMLFLYGIASKAYSHPVIRLKKYALTSWIVAGFFQGFFTYLIFILAIQNIRVPGLLLAGNLIPAALCTLLLWGSYPLTQVYQHEEDNKRGDITLSIKLGITGTFIFSAIAFLIADAGFIIYFLHEGTPKHIILFEGILIPMAVYFIHWFSKVIKDPSKADYSGTMRMNLISSFCLNLFFIIRIFL